MLFACLCIALSIRYYAGAMTKRSRRAIRRWRGSAEVDGVSSTGESRAEIGGVPMALGAALSAPRPARTLDLNALERAAVGMPVLVPVATAVAVPANNSAAVRAGLELQSL